MLTLTEGVTMIPKFSNMSSMLSEMFDMLKTVTRRSPLKQNFQVIQVDEDYVLHQLEEV